MRLIMLFALGIGACRPFFPSEPVGQRSTTKGLGSSIHTGIKELGEIPVPLPKGPAELGELRSLMLVRGQVLAPSTVDTREAVGSALRDGLLKIGGLPRAQLHAELSSLLQESACGGVPCSQVFGVKPDEIETFLDDEFLKLAIHPHSRNPEHKEAVTILLASFGLGWEERAQRWGLTSLLEKAFVRDYIDPFLGKIPEGFAPTKAKSQMKEAEPLEVYKNYLEFARTLRQGVYEIDPQAEALFQGSSVSGLRFPRESDLCCEQVPFRQTSDYDLAICSEKIFKNAQALKIPMRGGSGLRARTPPLNGEGETEDILKKLGLAELRQKLQHMAGRDVSFMVYKSCGGAIGAYPSIIVPR